MVKGVNNLYLSSLGVMIDNKGIYPGIYKINNIYKRLNISLVIYFSSSFKENSVIGKCDGHRPPQMES